MRISAKITGLSSMITKNNALQRALEEEAGDIVAMAAFATQAIAIRSIARQGSSSGQSIRYRPKRTVKVSSPGHPPNADTGRSIQSIQVEVDKEKKQALVGSNLKYMAWLELGTADMGARPWLLPAARAHAKQMAEDFKKSVQKTIRKILK